MNKFYFVFLGTFVLLAFSGQAQIVFPDDSEQNSAAIASDRIVMIDLNGSETERGTALRDLLGDLALDQYADVIVLEPGTYDIGSSPLAMVDGVSLYGFGARNTRITGSGSTVLQGACCMGIKDIKIIATQNSATVFHQAGGSTDFLRCEMQHNGDGSGTAYGVRVTGGGEVELQDSEVTFEANGSNGSFTGVHINGKENGGDFSSAYLTNTQIEIADVSGTMTLIGIQAGDGSTTPSGGEAVTLEVFGGVFEVIEGNSATALFVDGDADAFVSNACLETDDAALENDGVGAFINTIFDGSRTGIGTTVYSQCTAQTGSGPSPITNTNSSVP